ncbi:Na+/H+ antiporter subunit E [Chelatococcus sp. YT9]|uniref:Na+/H+ antiporter subunit E n=1 Tax=Chelatococcus sp. YT9 TaxID=2835635 RepID=UPI0024BE5A08|nr:Na+/H+ antiporter subunit E [Chelatococcus sp. YT9]
MTRASRTHERLTPQRLFGRCFSFLALWMILIGPGLKDLPIGLLAVLVATWASMALWPPGGSPSPRGIIGFLMYFLPRSVSAGIDVARRAMTTPPTLAPGVVTYRTSLPPGMGRDAARTVMSLQPGKLPIASESDGTLLEGSEFRAWP